MTTLLLADDDESSRFTLAAVLEDEGFDIEELESFASAHEAITGGHLEFDIAVLDQNLGDGFGSDLVAHIRKHRPRAKIFILTGDAGVDGVVVDGVLAKASDTLEIVARIRQAAEEDKQ